MKVCVQPVLWTVGQQITIEEVFDAIQRHANANPKGFSYADKQRRVYVGKDKDYSIVLFFSARDHQKTVELEQKDDGTVSIDINRGTAGKMPSDFNVLVMNNKNGRGLYLHYYSSCSFSLFTRLAKERYEEIKAARVGREIANTQTARNSETRAKKKFSGTLRGELLVRPERVEELVNELADVRRLELTAVQLRVDDNWFTPKMRANVRHVTHRFTFLREASVLSLRETAIELIRGYGARRGRIIGTEQTGGLDPVERIIKLSQNIDTFAEYDFDDIIEEVRFDPKSPEQMPLVIKILGIINSHRSYFEVA